MENIIKLLLVGQIDSKNISLRELHAEIEKLCEKDKSYTWFSLTTLSRRLNNPLELTDEETVLIRDAVRNVVSESTWIHMKRNITEGMKRKYSSQIEKAIENGFALKPIVVYNNKEDDEIYIKEISTFYKNAPQICKDIWERVVPTYLSMPDIAKASLMCTVYLGRNLEKNKEHEKRIMDFIDFFPVFQGINVINDLNPDKIRLLADILKLASLEDVDPNSIPPIYKKYAIDKNLIPEAENKIKTRGTIIEQALRYKYGVKDFKISFRDFIHGLCYTLFLTRTEWLLAYTTTLFFYKLEQVEDRYRLRRDYHTKGCSGFRFTDNELSYLCELLYLTT